MLSNLHATSRAQMGQDPFLASRESRVASSVDEAMGVLWENVLGEF